VDKQLMLQMYREMLFGRLFEEHVQQLFDKGLIPGSAHLGIGEEATQVGAVRALAPQDYICPNHREHVGDLAKGTDPKRLMAEILAKSTGTASGASGSCHLSDASCRNLGVQGIIGGVFPVAAGAALAQKRLKTGCMVLALFGDGCSNEGTFHEALNLSSVWKLPVVWVCVNNQYGMGTAHVKVSAVEDIADRACAYDMPGLVVDGNDVLAVYDAVSQARQRALAGDGPTLLECKTYRWGGHSTMDKRLYRPKEEVEAWLKRDPIPRFEALLRQQGILDDASVERIRAESRKAVDEAEEFALNSPEPRPESAMDLVFCPSEV